MSTPDPSPAPDRHQPEIVRVVGAAILRRGQCLVAQRSRRMAEPLKWEFPGGKIEDGESRRAALAREIREELDLVIDVGRSLGSGAHDGGGRRIELEVFAAAIVAGETRLREHRDYGWFGAADVARLDWAAADRPILPALVRLLERRSESVHAMNSPFRRSSQRND